MLRVWRRGGDERCGAGWGGARRGGGDGVRWGREEGEGKGRGWYGVVVLWCLHCKVSVDVIDVIVVIVGCGGGGRATDRQIDRGSDIYRER